MDTEISTLANSDDGELLFELKSDGKFKSIDSIRAVIPYANEYMIWILYKRMNEGLLDDFEMQYADKMLQRALDEEKEQYEELKKRMSNDNTTGDVSGCSVNMLE